MGKRQIITAVLLSTSLLRPGYARAVSANIASITLDQYKSQVKATDPSWRAADLAEQGGRKLEKEADSLTGVNFVTELDYMDDRRPTVNPAFMGDRTEYSGLFLGLKQQTPWGVQWSLTQNFAHTQIYDAPIQGIPMPNFYDSFPKLEVKVPLWRNFFGAETSSQVYQMDRQSELRLKQTEIVRIQKDVEIETAFYTVLAQQEAVDTQKDSLGRAERVLEWTKSRIARNLADKSDIYQSQAAVVARKIDLVAAEKGLKDSVAKFNSLRKNEARELSERLVPPAIDVDKLALSKAVMRTRKDLRLHEFENSSNEANYKAQREKHKPNLDLSVSALTQGRDTTLSAAQSETYDTNHTYLAASLNLTVPLNQFEESRFREGYANLVSSEKFSAEATAIDEKLAWEGTVDLANQLRDQFVMVRELETLQKNKADAERDKFNHGRSILFQVLSYEQDYLATRSQRISLELMVRQFVAQLALFE